MKFFNRLYDLKKLSKFYVFDVETWGLNATQNAFALGVIYGDGYVFKTKNVEELRRKLLSKQFRNSVIFAHNALYDLSTVFGNILTNLDNKAVFNNSTFILAQRNRITFADSLNILPAKLEKIGELMKYPKLETPDKFKEGKVCEITKEDFEYCQRDCEIIYKALENIFSEIGCVRLTLASLSMALFRRKYLDKAICYDDGVYEFFDSYFGGRVECFRIGDVNAQVFDINSMYPYSMKMAKFPDPAKLITKKNPKIEDLLFYLEYYEGLADITVNHKETYFGYLPHRFKNKLLFPIGKFRGKWNFPEIRKALEDKVISIIEVHSITYAPPISSPFINFVDALYKLRTESQNEFQKYMYKILLNSLYGKFAQKKKYKTTYVEDLAAAEIKDNSKIIPFSSEREDAYIVDESPYFSYNTIPLFSSYITSFARVLLLSKMVDYIDNDVVYVDTDSIAVNNYTTKIETGDELGMFKVENKIIVKIMGNKSYETREGKLTIKGISKSAQRLKNNVFVSKSMVKPKTSLRRNIQAGTFINITKVLSNKYDKREVFSDGTTRPISMSTIETFFSEET